MIPQKTKILLMLSTALVTLVALAPHGTQHNDAQTVRLNIVFDLGNVLIETSKARALWDIGPVKLALYTAVMNNPMNVRARFFDFLKTLEPKDPNTVNIIDEQGKPLPFIMEARLKGLYSHPELLERLDNEIRQSGAFPNFVEQRLMHALAHLIFNPTQFIKNQILNPDGLKLAQELKKQGHRLFILSNWDDSFPLLREKYETFFDLFDGIIVSHEAKHAKPEPEIYERLLTTYALKAQECIFIDDLEPNLAKAQELGFNTILCPRKRATYNPFQRAPDYDHIRTELEKLITKKLFLVPQPTAHNS